MSQGRLSALIAAWIVGVVGTAFAPIPFFYPIISVAPFTVLLLVCPVLGFALLWLAGRSELLVVPVEFSRCLELRKGGGASDVPAWCGSTVS